MTNYSTHLDVLDKQYHLHSRTNAMLNQSRGALMVTKGKGAFVSDIDGNDCLEAMSALWHANFGFDNAGLIEAAHAVGQTPSMVA